MTIFCIKFIDKSTGQKRISLLHHTTYDQALTFARECVMEGLGKETFEIIEYIPKPIKG